MADLPTNWVDNVGMIEDAAWLNLVGTNVNANTAARPLYGTFASRPAAATANSGALYFCSDTDAVYRSNGTTWTKIRVGGRTAPGLADPPSSGWSTTTLGTATVVADKDSRLFSMPNSGSNALRMEYRTLTPAINYTAVFVFEPTILNVGNYSYLCAFLRDSATGNAIHFGYNFAAGTASQFQVGQSSPSSIQDAVFGTQALINMPMGAPQWLRIRDDGTNRYYEFSYSGVDWSELFNHARTTYITPNQIGWGGANTGNSKTNLFRLRSFNVA